MKVERLNPECISCLLNKHLSSAPDVFSKAKKVEYMQGILKIISNADIYTSAPVIVEQINKFKESFGISIDFSDIKSYYNCFMLSMESRIEDKIQNSSDPLKTAVRYAMTGNYIDFGAMASVDEQKLNEILNNAKNIEINEQEFATFKNEVVLSKKIVYLTDNCGEIVLDKLLIKQILKLNNKVNVNVIVRGEPVLNDCTIEDAVQVGLDDLVSITGNGTEIAGTCLERISEKAKKLIDESDLIISKGQGNFETLHHSGKNIYYLFLCKCKMFSQRFGVDTFTGMFINEKNI